VSRASFGVAGPVVAGQATITNLPWRMDENRLKEVLDIPMACLMNDLMAVANAVPFLEPGDLHTLDEGEVAVGGSVAVIAPGTGLGEAYLTWDGYRCQAYASEGGHVDFAPVNELQVELLSYLQVRCDHVSYERVCSGKGIPNIYDFLKESGYAGEPSWLAEQLSSAADRTPVIINAAFNEQKPCELCSATLSTFVTILGAEAGNLALKVLETGGVYLGGGIPPRILAALEKEQFMTSFRSKGRLSVILSKMPVHVILNPKAALLGAACYGLELYKDTSRV
jgi:glucokinase